MIQGLPGENGAYNQPMESTGKTAFFMDNGSGWRVPPGTSEKIVEKWRRELQLCNCNNCYDLDCKCRQKIARFPSDAGGLDQCLRLMQDKSRYVWRNVDGTIIIIPDEVIEAIKHELET